MLKETFQVAKRLERAVNTSALVSYDKLSLASITASVRLATWLLSLL
jgi:hypothetical protein